MTAERVPSFAKHPPYEDVVDDLSIEYPSSDGEPMAEDDAQLTAMIDAISSLREWFDSREDIYTGGDMLVYYRINDNETRVAPDVFVVLGTEKHKRSSWIVWREGKAPDFVMEMASGSTWRRDMREKRDIYAEMGVTEYWRFDPSGEYLAPHLIGEHLTEGEYQGLTLEEDEQGSLRGHSAVLGLDLYVLPGPELRFRDPVSGEWLRTPHEEAAARREAEDENARLREQLRELQSRQ